MAGTSDTVGVAAPIGDVQALSMERMHYGLDVNQLKESFPELVYEQENGTVGINYVELIPVLVQTINELNARVQTLEGKTVRKAKSATEVSSVAEGSECQLQVVNNSDAKFVAVSYVVPTSAQSAEICICDMSGQLIKNEKIAHPGRGNVSVSTDGYSSGIYLFTLLLDGKVCDTKRVMIK